MKTIIQMDEFQITQLLFSVATKSEKAYKHLTVRQLCDIMEFCNKKMKSSKGNWSVNIAVKFCKVNDKLPLSLHRNLLFFYIQYSKRKKKNKGFKGFLDRLWRHVTTRGILRPHNPKPSLIDNSRLKEFLYELKQIKYEFLDCTDEQFLTFIKEGIETDSKYSKLRRYYYDKEELYKTR